MAFSPKLNNIKATPNHEHYLITIRKAVSNVIIVMCQTFHRISSVHVYTEW